MARPKKVEIEATEKKVAGFIPTPIEKLSVDYSSEGLNNMAKKINEIIDRLCH